MKKVLEWVVLITSLASFVLLIGIIRADEVAWIYKSEEHGRQTVVLHIDREPADAIVELWCAGSLRRFSKEQLTALVEEAAGK